MNMNLAPAYLIHKAIRTGVIIGEGFVHHQEHYAGQKGQSQNNKDGDLQYETKHTFYNSLYHKFL